MNNTSGRQIIDKIKRKCRIRISQLAALDVEVLVKMAA